MASAAAPSLFQRRPLGGRRDAALYLLARITDCVANRHTGCSGGTFAQTNRCLPRLGEAPFCFAERKAVLLRLHFTRSLGTAFPLCAAAAPGGRGGQESCAG